MLICTTCRRFAAALPCSYFIGAARFFCAIAPYGPSFTAALTAIDASDDEGLRFGASYD